MTAFRRRQSIATTGSATKVLFLGIWLNPVESDSRSFMCCSDWDYTEMFTEGVGGKEGEKERRREGGKRRGRAGCPI